MALHREDHMMPMRPCVTMMTGPPPPAAPPARRRSRQTSRLPRHSRCRRSWLDAAAVMMIRHDYADQHERDAHRDRQERWRDRQTGANCDSEWIHATVQRTQRYVPARLVARDNNRHTLIRNAVTKPEALLTLRAKCEPIKPRRRNVRSREDPCPCTRVERVGEDSLRACDVSTRAR